MNGSEAIKGWNTMRAERNRMRSQGATSEEVVTKLGEMAISILAGDDPSEVTEFDDTTGHGD